MLSGHAQHPIANEDELTQLSEQSTGEWRARLVAMMQGAPA